MFERVATRLLVLVLGLPLEGAVAAPASDLTIEVSGELLQHGGVVVVYPIPVDTAIWSKDIGTNPPATVRLDARYTHIQLRYPADQTYHYRFRLVAGSAQPDQLMTHVLSVIGTDEKNQGPQMKSGFTDAYSSGGRIIRIPARAEYAGQDEATRTDARWGRTQRYDAVPPADERSARALQAMMENDRQEHALACVGGATVQLCAVPVERWPRLEARWWRHIAEMRLERLQHYALRRCYDNSFWGGGQCDADPKSNEPDFVKRK